MVGMASSRPPGETPSAGNIGSANNPTARRSPRPLPQRHSFDNRESQEVLTLVAMEEINDDPQRPLQCINLPEPQRPLQCITSEKVTSRLGGSISGSIIRRVPTVVPKRPRDRQALKQPP